MFEKPALVKDNYSKTKPGLYSGILIHLFIWVDKKGLRPPSLYPFSFLNYFFDSFLHFKLGGSYSREIETEYLFR